MSPNRNADALVSVIIPNYNGREMLEACLNSLLRMHSRNLIEIMVVDNASRDGSTEMIRTKFNSVKVISLKANFGFAAAVNVGVKSSVSDFVAMINNDVEVEPEWLNQLLTAFTDPAVAAATGKLLFKNRPDTVNDLGGIIMLNGAGLQLGLGMLDKQTLEVVPVGVPSGAASLIRRRDFIDAGGFDDSYFAYFEDVDLGWRLWQRGRKIVHVPSAVAYHCWGGTSESFGPGFRVYHGAKNSFATLVKNAQARYLPQAALLWVLRLLFLLSRSPRPGIHCLATLRAIKSCSHNWELLIRERQAVQNERRISDKQLRKLGVLGSLGEVMRQSRNVDIPSPGAP